MDANTFCERRPVGGGDMFKWILIETKQLLFKKKTILLLGLILVLTGFMVMNEHALYQSSLANTIQQLEMDAKSTQISNDFIVLEEEHRCSLSYEDYILEYLPEYGSLEAFESETGNNIETFNELMGLSCAKLDLVNSNQELLDSYLSNDRRLFVETELKTASNDLAKLMNSAYPIPEERILEFFESKDQLQYYDSVLIKVFEYQDSFQSIEDLGIMYSGLADKYMINYPAIKSSALYEILENDLPYIYEHELTPSTVILYYFQYYGVMVVLFVLILGFDSIFSDIEDGSIKTILSGPGSRYKYYVVKSFSILIVAHIILILPIFLLSLSLGFMQGFDSFRTPTFAYTRGYTRILHDIPYDGNTPGYLSNNFKHLGTTGLLSKGPILTDTLLDEKIYTPMSFHLSVTSLCSMVFMSTLFTTLQFMFIISLNMFTSIFVKSKEQNIFLLISFIGLGLIVYKVFDGLYINLFNPFSFLDCLSLVQGIVPFTYFNGIVVFVICILFLQIICYKMIRNIDIQS